MKNSLTNFLNQFDENDIESLSKIQRKIILNMIGKNDFWLKNDTNNVLPNVKDFYTRAGYQIVEVDVRSMDDLRGKPVIFESESGFKSFSYHLSWADPIIENADQTFLVLFYIDNAGPDLISRMKSFIDAHDLMGVRPGNFIVGLVSTKEDIEEGIDVPQTIRNLVRVL